MPNPTAVINETIKAMQAVLRQAPGELGAIAVNHYKRNFALGGFMDATLKPWPKRKKNRSKDEGRALLVLRGRLKNNIRIFRKNDQEIVIGNSLLYAKIHNEGGTIIQYPRSSLYTLKRSASGRFKRGKKAGRGFTYGKRIIKIPQRQFIGDSAQLRDKMKDWYLNKFKQANIIK